MASLDDRGVRLPLARQVGGSATSTTGGAVAHAGRLAPEHLDPDARPSRQPGQRTGSGRTRPST